MWHSWTKALSKAPVYRQKRGQWTSMACAKPPASSCLTHPRSGGSADPLLHFQTSHGMSKCHITVKTDPEHGDQLIASAAKHRHGWGAHQWHAFIFLTLKAFPNMLTLKVHMRGTKVPSSKGHWKYWRGNMESKSTWVKLHANGTIPKNKSRARKVQSLCNCQQPSNEKVIGMMKTWKGLELESEGPKAIKSTDVLILSTALLFLKIWISCQHFL